MWCVCSSVMEMDPICFCDCSAGFWPAGVVCCAWDRHREDEKRRTWLRRVCALPCSRTALRRSACACCSSTGHQIPAHVWDHLAPQEERPEAEKCNQAPANSPGWKRWRCGVVEKYRTGGSPSDFRKCNREPRRIVPLNNLKASPSFISVNVTQ